MLVGGEDEYLTLGGGGTLFADKQPVSQGMRGG
jgi:hypothetical protein